MEYISTLIIGRNTKAREAEIQKIVNQYNINKFDINTVEKVKPSTSKQKVFGIEDIRNAQNSLYLAPLKGDSKAVLFECDDITLEAQNALLKILEEPPKNTLLIISIPTIQKLLPTILSRCKVISVEEQTGQQESDIFETANASIGGKLKKAETVGKDRETALEYLLNTIKFLRKQLYENVLEDKNSVLTLEMYHSLLSKLNNTYTTIATTNVSPRFALEILFLSLE